MSIPKQMEDRFGITGLKNTPGWSTAQERMRHFVSHVEILHSEKGAKVQMFFAPVVLMTGIRR